MHFTLAQTLSVATTLGAGWLMVRIGAAKSALKIKRPERCAACGRTRVRRRCECTTPE
jgi:hypothetical protein